MKRVLQRPALRVAVCALPVVLEPALAYLHVAPFDALWLTWLRLPLMIAALAAVPTLAVSLVFVCFRRWRRGAGRLVVGSLVVVTASFFGVRLGDHIRMEAFRSLAERSAPLVGAIRAYEVSRSAPPFDLPALVPEFLPSVPGTGMASYPSFEYYVGDDASDAFQSNHWALVVSTPGGFLNFDQFMYLPFLNYPEHGYGGVLERVGDWAYVHE